LKISNILNKISKKNRDQPNSFNGWERDMMSVPKSKNPKIFLKKIFFKKFTTLIYIILRHTTSVFHSFSTSLEYTDHDETDGWSDGWMMKQMDEMVLHDVLYYM